MPASHLLLVVLCDLRRPDVSGQDVLRAVRHATVDSPIVVACLEQPVSPEQLLDVVKRHLNRRPARPEPLRDPRVSHSHAARATHLIETRYAEPGLSARAVARALGLSRQHVCRILKHHAGLTFSDLLRNVRLREARRLLAEQSCSMKEIAYLVGFRHPSRFTRAFRDDCGLPPSAYRHRHSDETLARSPRTSDVTTR